jgi:hypothetical protein
MTPKSLSSVTLLEPSFVRLFAALGGGVALVTGLFAFTAGSAGLCLALSVLAMAFFALVVLHEVGRLLADEAGEH